MEGEGGDPLGKGAQSLPGGLPLEVLFGPLEEFGQVALGLLGAADALHAPDGEAGGAGEGQAQVAQDVQ
ncbi:MAG: hypothetical protein RML36_17400, partial [Anaerolineae bacterium]|nr:hypothetical protein [Anaerolineae bacterium]